MLNACLQIFDKMGCKIFGWELNTPLVGWIDKLASVRPN
jgi:hypothetical protein